MTNLDIERPADLIEYLRRTDRIGGRERPTVRVLRGGVSNRTVLVRRAGGESWVIKQALAKLRVQADWYSDPARVGREAEGLRWLEALTPPGATTPLAFEDPQHNLLAMEAVPEPHANWKTMLLAGDVRQGHVEQFGRLLGTLHSSAECFRRPLMDRFGDMTHFESLRLEPYYAHSARQVPRTAGFLHDLIDSCRRNRFTLVHGDYSPKNVLVHQERLVLVDHEVIHFGDGAFDLGFAMTHLLSKAHHLPEHRRALTDAVGQFWRAYRSAAGETSWMDGLERRAVRHALGCLLARVAGRSPLEYLGPRQRDRQRQAAVETMDRPPETVGGLISEFINRIS